MTSANLRRWLLGEPLATKQERHQRLSNILALPVFASDALSSTAYATEEILLVLMLAGTGAFHFTGPIAVAIGALLIIVAMSYRQTIYAYPTGGGAFLVTRDNLGLIPGLVAAAALLIDYVLTVSVSMAAGVLAITSATNGTQLEFLGHHRVELCWLFILMMTIANLRGLKESGTLFAIPAYLFIASLFTMIVVGLVKYFAYHVPPMKMLLQVPPDEMQSVSVFLILRAFASGCAALTGVEAVADGIPSFRPPESHNAAKTLTAMAAILTFLFLGLTVLAYLFHAQPVIAGVAHGHVTGVKESLISHLARYLFGRSPFYYVLQAGTAMILILAANTSYQDFPRLSSILARNSLAPRQLANLGDRLVFQNGILLLGFFSGLLVYLFHGEVDHLIPLYAVGVFLSFTLSQTGMVKRWLSQREPGWQRSVFFNAVGATATGTVLCVIVYVKFLQGAWIVIAFLPILVTCFVKINQHYRRVGDGLSVEGYQPPRRLRHRVLMLIPGVNRGVLEALQYAQAISQDVEAIHVEIDPKRTATTQEAWKRFGGRVPLRVLKSPWRSLIQPLSKYIDLIVEEDRLDYVTIIIPEFVTTKWWHRLLHNSTGLMLKFALLFKHNVVVANVRYYLEEADHDS